MWQSRLWWAVWLSLGSSHHSPHHCCGLWAGHNTTLTRAARKMKQQVAQQLPKPAIYPIHGGNIARLPSIFFSSYQKKAVNPYVLKWDWLWYPLHKHQDVLFRWATQRSPSPSWPAGAVKHSRHSSTLTSKAISAALLDDQSFSLK